MTRTHLTRKIEIDLILGAAIKLAAANALTELAR